MFSFKKLQELTHTHTYTQWKKQKQFSSCDDIWFPSLFHARFNSLKLSTKLYKTHTHTTYTPHIDRLLHNIVLPYTWTLSNIHLYRMNITRISITFVVYHIFNVLANAQTLRYITSIRRQQRARAKNKKMKKSVNKINYVQEISHDFVENFHMPTKQKTNIYYTRGDTRRNDLCVCMKKKVKYYIYTLSFCPMSTPFWPAMYLTTRKLFILEMELKMKNSRTHTIKPDLLYFCYIIGL